MANGRARVAVDQDTRGGGGEEDRDPIMPSLAKAKVLKGLVKEGP